MTKVERIEKMLQTEKQIRAREDKDKGVSLASVRAETRAGCLEEVLKVLR